MSLTSTLSSVRIELLSKDNHDTWKIQAEALLVKNANWGYVSGAIPKPTTGSDAIATWVDADRKAKSDLILSISPPELKQIRGCVTSRDVWLRLEAVFASKGPARKATLLKNLTVLRLQEGEDVREHVYKFFDTVDKLEDMQVNVNADLLTIMLLYSLPGSFENFRCAIESRDQLPGPEDLKIKILEETEARKQNTMLEAQGAMVAKRTGRVTSKSAEHSVNKSGSRSNQGTFKYKCFKCHQVGHKASDCRRRKGNSSANAEEEVPDESFAVFCGVATAYQVGQQTESDKNPKKPLWILDSGCTSHLCGDQGKFSRLDTRAKGNLSLASHGSTKIEGRGAIRLSAETNGEKRSVEFLNTLFVPDLRANLISVAKITDHGHTVTFMKDNAVVTNQAGEVKLTADRKGDLYLIRESASLAKEKPTDPDVRRWHERLGHVNAKDLAKILQRYSHKIPNDNLQDLRQCDACLKGKFTRLPFCKGGSPCHQRLEVIHTDVAGPMRVESLGGARYFVTFIDDCTRWCEVYLLSKKSGVLDAFKAFKSLAEKQTGAFIKCLQSDNGREYINGEFEDFLKEEGITRRLTVTHTPQQNGTAERMNRTLIEMARCMLLQSQLPEAFWAEALATACHIRNRCPTNALGGKIPYEQWYGVPLKIDYLRTFGCKVYVLDKTPGKDKFRARSREGIFIGYPRSVKGYRIWVPEERKVVIARDVKFIEEVSMEDRSEDGRTSAGAEILETPTQAKDEVVHEPSTAEAPTQTKHEFVRKPSTAEAPAKVQSRAPGRPKLLRTGLRGRPRKVYRTLSGGEESDVQLINSEEVDDDVFVNFAGHAEISMTEAMSSDERDEWENAILTEITSLILKDTWEIVEKPKGANVVGNRFVLTNKYGADGTTVRKKARLVAKGFSQKYGVDYHHTFAPVARLETIRLLCAAAVELKLQIHQLDITTAYLNGYLEEEVFMKIPERLQEMLERIVHREGKNDLGKRASVALADLKTKGNVCKLKRALYGLKQAGRQWHNRLTQKLTSMGLLVVKREPCMYFATNKSQLLIVVIYVDDLLIASQDVDWIDATKRNLAEDFELRDFGRVKFCLGIEINQTSDAISMSQAAYTRELLRRFRMQDCNSVTTPMEVGVKLVKTDGRCNAGESRPYRELIGALIYLSMATRPDITNAVAKLAQFCDFPGEVHWRAAKRILRYLKGTVDLGLVYHKTDLRIVGYSDAEWGGCEVDRRSFSGYNFTLGGAAISWKSQKQPTAALSSTEAEYMALTEAAKEAMYLRGILNELEILEVIDVVVYVDNQGAEYLAHYPMFHKRTKHIDIKYHFVRDAVNRGEVTLRHLPTGDMVADIFTKPLPGPRHRELCEKLGLRIVNKI